ncbi:MAG: phosphoglycerate kinase, partial [Sphingopyxis sp.]|nr:phosphoglycerate kinase [Sphingopyxis sp.]
MTAFKTLDDIGDVTGKRVLVRVDLNVPMNDGAVGDRTRIEAAMPTIRELADKGAIVLLLAHFGRPKGAKNPTQSLSLVMGGVEDVLGHSVMFIPECVGEGAKAGLAVLAAGDVAVLENTRFYPGEETNDPAFADALAEIGDLYVNDAFSAAHR